MSKKIEEIVFELAQPIAAENGCEVFEIEFKKEGKDYFLRVFLDKIEGITLDDCEKVSRPLSVALDEADPIEQPYYLEVSSPGIERPLKKEKDFERFIGHKIEIKLYAPIDGKKVFGGILAGFDGENIMVSNEGKTDIIIPKSKAASVKLAIEI